MRIRDVLPRDAIPSIDDPTFQTTYIGQADDCVLVIEETTPAKAYPLRILHYHEIVNDVIDTPSGHVPVAITWCPLCGSAVVYERRVAGRCLEFGVSGKLADDDLVMYDRETESEWKQSSGTCIGGALAGATLTTRPGPIMSFERFREVHEAGLVLQPPGMPSEVASEDDTPAPVNYDVRPYRRYFERDGFGLDAHREQPSSRSWDRSDLSPKTVVLGIERGDTAVAIPEPWVRETGGCLHTAVDDTRIVVFAVDDELHAFESGGIDIQPTDGAFSGDGTTWHGDTGRSADGRKLDRVPAKRMFAFAWQDDHGEDAFISRRELGTSRTTRS